MSNELEMSAADRRSFEDIVGQMLKDSNVEGDAKTIANKIIKIAKDRAVKDSFGSYCYIDPAEIREMVINNAELSIVEAREAEAKKQREEALRAAREAEAEKMKAEKAEAKKQEKIARQIEREKHTAEGEQLSLFE